MGLATTAAARLPQRTQGWVSLLQRALDFPIESVAFPPHFYLHTFTKGTDTASRFSPQLPPLKLTTQHQSAVLLLLSPAETGTSFQDMCITLTKRTETLASHKGEMSFPGGRVDADETPRDAAQREALEEAGLLPAEYDIIGSLSPIATNVHGTRVTPFVAVANKPAQARCASPDEVASIHYLHLSNLLLKSSTRHARLIKDRSSICKGPCLFPCFFASPAQTVACPAVCPSPKAARVEEDCGFDPMLPEDFPGELVWGITAFIVCELVARIAQVITGATEVNKTDAVNALLTPSNVVARDPLAQLVK